MGKSRKGNGNSRRGKQSEGAYYDEHDFRKSGKKKHRPGHDKHAVDQKRSGFIDWDSL